MTPELALPSRGIHLSIMNQLLQNISPMRSSNELFSWLAQRVAQGLGTQVIQFWSKQKTKTNDTAVDVLASVHGNGIVNHVVDNTSTREVVKRMLSEQSSLSLQAVHDIFPAPQSMLLSRHGIQYCAGYLLHASLPVSSAVVRDAITELVVMTYWQQLPYERVLASLERVLEHSSSLAHNRGLLAVPLRLEKRSRNTQSTNTRVVTVQASPAMQHLGELVPYRTQHDSATRTHNPLSVFLDITDKDARQFYLAIDGQKNVRELANVLYMSFNKVLPILRLLVNQQYVQLFGLDGQSVDTAFLFESRS
ncbi:MAG: hypothetical protein E6J34_11620 [Chloroflexi bacterium]|nr:MAG: hypothetical protein E6J34_11620 [Chloroflexota bacterium]